MHTYYSRKTFIIYHLIAFTLFFSWYATSTTIFWTKLDLFFFYLFNDSLPESPLMQVFWALGNVKITDLFGAIFMTTFTLLWVFEAKEEARFLRLAQFLYLLVWFEIGILTLKEVIFPYLVKVNFLRDSPSLVYPSTFMLSEVMPWLKIKDSSHWCFPGDHALIALQWALFMLTYAGPRLGIVACISSCFFLLPRLYAGAHWLSDALCGSLPLALLIVAWATCTPLYTYGIQAILKFCKKLQPSRKAYADPSQ